LRDLEMAFLGKITASMTHEIKNTYAIILESSGLLTDLLTLSQQDSFPPKEKFHRVLGTIDEQVRRGVVLATRLNQFAHSMDEPVATVKVGDLLELVVALMQRLARRRGIELQVIPSSGEISITSDPFRLQLVLASVIEELADALESGGKIILQAPPMPQEVTILLEVQGQKKGALEDVRENLSASLKDFLEALGAKLAVLTPPAPEGIMLITKTPQPA
jgi:signal transduction histidine kinase